MRISDWSSDVCSSDLADLADEPFILLERHPVARAPAMVAVAGGVELDHALAETQRAPDAAGLFDAIGRAIGRAAARVGCIGIRRMEGVEVEIERGLGGFPATMRGGELEILLHLEASDLTVD